MKKIKKLLAVLMAMAMVLMMAIPVLADENDEVFNDSEVDTTEATTYAYINGLQPLDTYRYGQIIKLNSEKNGYELTALGKQAAGSVEDGKSGLSETDILNLLVGTDGTMENSGQVRQLLNWFANHAKGGAGGTVPEGSTSARLQINAGVYAVKAIPGPNADPDVVYSPMMLVSAKLRYDENGNMIGIFPDDDTSVTVKTTTTTYDMDKTITDKANDTTGVTGSTGIHSYSVGDTINYQVRLDVPVFDPDTINRTFYIYDTFPAGVDYVPNSVQFAVVEKGNNPSVYEKPNGVNAVLDQAGTDETTFALYFNYDNLQLYEVDDDGAVVPKEVYVIYQGILNEEAIVGQAGNTNTVVEILPHDPNMGQTADPTNGPKHPSGSTENPFDGFIQDEDEETVYTYGFYIVKRDSNDAGSTLKDAQFQVYVKNGERYDALQIDGEDVLFTTNEDGIGGVAGLKAGNYYVKETKAPAGYSLLNGYTEVMTNYLSSAKVTKTTTVSSWKGSVKIDYEVLTEALAANGNVQATDANGNLLYLTADKNVTTEETEWPAYEVSRVSVYGRSDESKVVTKDTIYTDSTASAHTVPAYEIKNTKLGELPSTGGVGTIIFSVIGIVGMIAGVAIFFGNRRRVVK